MKEKYRIKWTGESIHKEILKVQVKKWYGWVTIKTFPEFDLLDGNVDVTKPDDKHYITICAEELLEHLKEDV